MDALLLSDAAQELYQNSSSEAERSTCESDGLSASNEGAAPDSIASETASAQEAAQTAAEKTVQEATETYSFEEGKVGLGVDIVEIRRMESILERRPNFAKRVFSEDEIAYCTKHANPAVHFALRFAAKEAVVKALGLGFSEGIGVRDIEVKRAANGKPSVVLSGRAKEIAQEQGVRELPLSLSYTHNDAVACAMAITEASVKSTEERKDPHAELAKKFKETRSILDEL